MFTCWEGQSFPKVLLSNQYVSYKEVSNIDFSCPKTLKTNVPGPEKKKEVPSSTPTEIELVHPYNLQYKPKSNQSQTKVKPESIQEIYPQEHIVELLYREHLAKSKESFTVSVLAVDSATNLIHVCGFTFELDIQPPRKYTASCIQTVICH